jgi:hypothetical protein
MRQSTRALLALIYRISSGKKMFINISTRFVQQYDFYSGLQIGTEAGEGTEA